MNRKIYELYDKYKEEEKNNPNEYYFDNPQNIFYKNYEYDTYKIEVVSLKPDIDVEKYLSFIIITVENLVISYLLKLEYNTISSTKIYFDELCSLVENNNLNDIIDYIYGNIYGNNVGNKNSD